MSNVPTSIQPNWFDSFFSTLDGMNLVTDQNVAIGTGTNKVDVFLIGLTQDRTVTLPALPAAGQVIKIGDGDGSCATFRIIISGNGYPFDGGTQFIIGPSNGGARATVALVFVGGNTGWKIVSFTAGGGGGGGTAFDTVHRINDASFTSTDTTNALFSFRGLTAQRTLTLPNAPTTGQRFTVLDEDGSLATQTIVLSGNGKTINGNATHIMTSDVPFGAVLVEYDGNEYRLEAIAGNFRRVFPAAKTITGGVTSVDVARYVRDADGADASGRPDLSVAIGRAYAAVIKPAGGGRMGISSAPGSWSWNLVQNLNASADGVSFLEIVGEADGGPIFPDLRGGSPKTMLQFGADSNGFQKLLLTKLAFVGVSTVGTDVVSIAQTLSDTSLVMDQVSVYGMQSSASLFDVTCVDALVQDCDVSNCWSISSQHFLFSGGVFVLKMKRTKFVSRTFRGTSQSKVAGGTMTLVRCTGDTGPTQQAKMSFEGMVFAPGNGVFKSVDIDPAGGRGFDDVDFDTCFWLSNPGLPIDAHDVNNLNVRGSSFAGNTSPFGSLHMRATANVGNVRCLNDFFNGGFTIWDLQATSLLEAKECRGLGTSTLKVRTTVGEIDFQENDAAIGTVDVSVAKPLHFKEKLKGKKSVYVTNSAAATLLAGQIVDIDSTSADPQTIVSLPGLSGKGPATYGVVRDGMTGSAYGAVYERGQRGIPVINSGPSPITAGQNIQPSTSVSGDVQVDAASANSMGIAEEPAAASAGTVFHARLL